MDTLPGWLSNDHIAPLSAAQTAAFAAYLYRNAPELKPWLNSVAVGQTTRKFYGVIIWNDYDHAETAVRISKPTPQLQRGVLLPANEPNHYQAACISWHVIPAPPCPRNLGIFPTLPQALHAAAHHCARSGEQPANIDRILQHALAIRNRPW